MRRRSFLRLGALAPLGAVFAPVVGRFAPATRAAVPAVTTQQPAVVEAEQRVLLESLERSPQVRQLLTDRVLAKAGVTQRAAPPSPGDLIPEQFARDVVRAATERSVAMQQLRRARGGR